MFTLLELLQKAHVAGVELADFADTVLHHGNAFDAHAKGEAADFFRVVGGLLPGSESKHSGVDHATTEKLDPAGLLAFAAAAAATEDAADLHIGRGLGKREERGEEPGLDVGSKERLHSVVER